MQWTLKPTAYRKTVCLKVLSASGVGGTVAEYIYQKSLVKSSPRICSPGLLQTVLDSKLVGWFVFKDNNLPEILVTENSLSDFRLSDFGGIISNTLKFCIDMDKQSGT